MFLRNLICSLDIKRLTMGTWNGKIIQHGLTWTVVPII